MSVTDEIKDRLNIEDLVGQYVQLKKVGRSLKGLCPFHNEKTPSFIVSPEKGMAYCFGCNKGGDIFKFIQEIEGVDFPDALKILAERTGVKLLRENMKADLPKDQKDVLIAIHDEVVKFYENNLWHTAEGEKVLEYIRRRGVNEENIRKFRLGYAPDSYDQTYSMLISKGYGKRELVMAGVALSAETTVDKIYDRFRGRLMFPIFDHFGRVVGFGGRALKKEQEPKYMNSPETPIYHKSSTMYGFSFSKQFIKEAGAVMLVEGYFDYIMAFQDGVKNLVAVSGTALTQKHLRILKPFADRLLLSFDMDLAGQAASGRAYEMAKPFNYEVLIVQIPAGKDPADFVRANPAKLIECVRTASPYADFFYQKLIRDFGTDTISAKKKILQEFLPLFNQLQSKIEKDEYVRKLAYDLGVKESQVYDEISNMKLPAYHPARQAGAGEASGGGVSGAVIRHKYTADDQLLGLILSFPEVALGLRDKIDINWFSEDLKPIYKEFVEQYNTDRVGSGFDVVSILTEESKELANVLSLYISEKYGELTEEAAREEIQALISTVKKDYLNIRTRELARRISEAEKNDEKENLKALLQELSNLRIYGAN